MASSRGSANEAPKPCRIERRDRCLLVTNTSASLRLALIGACMDRLSSAEPESGGIGLYVHVLEAGGLQARRKCARIHHDHRVEHVQEPEPPTGQTVRPGEDS